MCSILHIYLNTNPMLRILDNNIILEIKIKVKKYLYIIKICTTEIISNMYVFRSIFFLLSRFVLF